MAVSLPTFPELSRAPQMDERESYDDPSIRDKMENGVVFSRPRYPRLRRTLRISYKHLSGDDRQAIRDFIKRVGGWGDFHLEDDRLPDNPEILRVYFSKLPEFTDGGWENGQKVFSCTFEVTER
jgi:hypothetical protein